mmetsp:Transcript_40159/g.126989  ORF Transcript_40159/g.126989 Transcript_40159/m.126989 type:complete len:280 (+) Transcript_40159:848-1687(+)
MRKRPSHVFRKVEPERPPCPESHGRAWRSEATNEASPPSQKRWRSAANAAGKRIATRAGSSPPHARSSSGSSGGSSYFTSSLCGPSEADMSAHSASALPTLPIGPPAARATSAAACGDSSARAATAEQSADERSFLAKSARCTRPLRAGDPEADAAVVVAVAVAVAAAATTAETVVLDAPVAPVAPVDEVVATTELAPAGGTGEGGGVFCADAIGEVVCCCEAPGLGAGAGGPTAAAAASTSLGLLPCGACRPGRPGGVMPKTTQRWWRIEHTIVPAPT